MMKQQYYCTSRLSPLQAAQKEDCKGWKGFGKSFVQSGSERSAAAFLPWMGTVCTVDLTAALNMWSGNREGTLSKGNKVTVPGQG